jgi:DNA-directed RNA polymerase subunit alpha
MSLSDLDLSQRAYNCLMRAGIKTCEDLCKYSEEDLMKIRTLGKKSADEIIAKMRAKGLKLREDVL